MKEENRLIKFWDGDFQKENHQICKSEMKRSTFQFVFNYYYYTVQVSLFLKLLFSAGLHARFERGHVFVRGKFRFVLGGCDASEPQLWVDICHCVYTVCFWRRDGGCWI